MAPLGGVQRRDLPGQVVIPRPGRELVDAHRHNPRSRNAPLRRSGQRRRNRNAKRCAAQGILKWAGGTRNRSEGSAVTAYFGDGFGPVTDPWRGGIKVMSQQSVGQAGTGGRRWMPRPCCVRKRADRERRLEGWRLWC